MTDFRVDGKPIDDVPVQVSYHIINLFSGQLYQSGAKAIEELVVNSYDALADHCHIVVPRGLKLNDRIIVIDDGQSMDVEGLHDLWWIAHSKKRESESSHRPPIGRFGIGKLATYALASELTYVCKKDGRYLAITMDYRALDTGPNRPREIRLPIRELTEAQAHKLLDLAEFRALKVKPALFGEQAKPSWTVAILSALKPKALEVQLGRLRWVLSTALPIAPDFRVFLNGERVISRKENIPLLKSWTIGDDDKAAATVGYESVTLPKEEAGHKHEVRIPGLGVVWGEAELYEDSITGGKSDELIGRSNGFFVMARGRLVNQENATFGLQALSHSTWSRFRLVVHADGLDPYLVASRESVMDNEDVEALRKYLLEKFNEARSFLARHTNATDYERRLSTKLNALPSSLVGRPLRNLISRSLEDGEGTLVRTPPRSDTAARAALQAEIDSDDAIPKSLIHDVRHRGLGIEAPIAVYEARERIVYLNRDHPFYANFVDSLQSHEPLEVIGLLEVLTESYLFDQGVSAPVVSEVIRLRDDLLRSIVSSAPLSVTQIAARLRDSSGEEDALQGAIIDAFRALGFEVVTALGPKAPDGIARAQIGYVAELKADGSYDLAFEAISANSVRAKTPQALVDQLLTYQQEHNVPFIVVALGRNVELAPGYDSLERQLKALQFVTPIRASDLADLVEAKAARFLSLYALRDLFESCKTPAETRHWIETVVKAPAQVPPIAELLDVVYELQKDKRDSVDLGQVKQYEGRLRRYGKHEIATFFSGIQSLVPTLVIFRPNSGHVELHATPEKILKAIAESLGTMPEIVASPMRRSLPAVEEPASGEN